MVKDSEGREYDGFISSFKIHGKTYALKAVMFESHPVICKRCGATFEIDSYGKGKCRACGTNYSSQIVLVEDN